MSEVLRFTRRIENGYDGEKLKIEKIGTSSFRIITGNSSEFDFRNRMRAQRFDVEFVSQLNQFLSPENQLDAQDRDVYNSLNDLRRKLEEDVDHFDFKISFRMTH